jgi:hypothetical protein
MAKKAESRLQLRIRKGLQREVGGKWFKVHGGPFQSAGLPDLIGCVDGLFFGFEVKLPNDPKSKPTALQLATIAEYQSEGGYVCVVESLEEAVAVVRAATAASAERRFGRRQERWLLSVLRSAHREDVDVRRSGGTARRTRGSSRRSKNQSRKYVA